MYNRTSATPSRTTERRAIKTTTVALMPFIVYDYSG